MKKLFLFPVFILASLAIFVSQVSAQSLLRYPISDLGYCRDAKECYLYCEIPTNKAACWSYGKFVVGAQVLGLTTLSTEEKSAMQEKARQMGIIFPVNELGSCAGPQECRDFCEQPANQAVCINFAKSHGLDKSSDAGSAGNQVKEQEILKAAQSELGCTTKESCYKICESDHSKCEAFASKHGLNRAGADQGNSSAVVDRQKLLEDARTELECTSMESCSQTCKENPQKCAEFAKRHGMGGGPSPGPYQGSRSIMGSVDNSSVTVKGPGGCDSEMACRTYCQSHPSECPGYQPGTSKPINESYKTTEGGFSGSSYVGPTGCRTQAECESYCKANPTSCPGYSKAQQQINASGPTNYYPQPSGSYQPPSGSSYPSPTGSYTSPSGNYSSPPSSGGYMPPPH